MKNLLPIILTTLLFTSCNSNDPRPEYKGLSVENNSKKEALILGVSDYMGTQYDLNGVKQDVLRMEKLFKSWGFNVTLIKSADSMNLESYLANYTNLKANDNFIFYYSGHGFYTKDINGDEADGKDEALVLSDGKKDKLFIDDALFGYLNAIKAKKLVIFDSCHSGTVFKAFGDKPKPKTITNNQVSGIIKTKAFRVVDSQLAKGQYIVLSASQDKEQSLDTVNGGMFTNALLHQFQNGGMSKRLMNMRQEMENEIVQNCRVSDSIPHHPKLSASSDRLKYTSIDKFFHTQKSEPPLATKNITIMGAKSFKSGDLLDFKIDTQGNSGYLTIFSIEDGQPFVMYKSSQPQKGVFNFKDFNIQPPIECYKACTNCASEKSVVYVAFSAKPVKISELLTNTKSFRHQKEATFKTVIKKFETTIY